jgi:hypothetical protein
MFVGHQFGSPETMVEAGQKSIEHYIYPPIITKPKHAEIYRKMAGKRRLCRADNSRRG